MDNNSYTTGTWLGIVRHGAAVVLEDGTDPAIVARLWDLLGAEPTIHGVLHEVTEQFGTGLANLPSFAILLHGERLHTILRGNITLAAHTADATELVSGRDVTTWSERSLPLPDSVDLTFDGAPAGTDGLPLAGAVVRLATLHMAAQPAGGGLQERRGLLLDKAQPAAPGSLAHGSQAQGSLEHDGGLPAQLPSAASGAVAGAAGLHGLANLDGPADIGPESSDSLETDGPASLEGADSHGTAADEELSDSRLDDFAGGYEDAVHPLEEHFALAAAAANAEWDAQLAPMDVPGAPLDGDLNLTIRPDGEDGESGFDAAGLVDSPDQAGAGYGDSNFGGATPAADESGAEAGASGDDGLDVGTDDGLGAATLHGRPDDEPAGSEPADAAADLAEDGFTTNYDFLFGATVAKSVEGAAVRADGEEEDTPAPLAEKLLPPLPSQPPAAGNTSLPAGPDGDPDAEPGIEIPASLMIESVPWGLASRAAAAAAPAKLPEPPELPLPVEGDRDLLAGFLGDGADGSGGSGTAGLEHDAYDPDHDGHTVMRSDLGLEAAPEVAAVLESRPPTGPMVLARVCPNGHANPPSLSACFTCGTAITSEPREVGRPRLGTMHISSGEVVELDHSLIVGRQPSVSRVMVEAMPRLVHVQSPNGDISRSHVEVRLDGWDVLLVDLKATNGTILVREGQAPRRLGEGEEAILLNGDIAELGDGVSLLFDGLL